MGGFGDLLASFANGFAKAGEASRAFNLEMQSLGETLRGTLETGVAAALDGWAKGTKTASEAFSSMINSMITEINKMMSRRVVHAFLDMLFGGGWSLGPRLGNGQADMGIGVLDDGTEFAHGGIVNAPTRALIGEAGPEAVVPLSRGRAIPVEIKDLAGGRDDSRDIGVTINISAVDGASVQRMLLSDDGKRAIQTALRDARSTRRDLRW